MKTTALLLIQLLAAGAVSAATADEPDKDVIKHGEELHGEYCTKCHTDQVYLRDNRFVKSLQALSKQVERCKNNTGAPWFDEDTEAVVQFLDTRYYKF